MFGLGKYLIPGLGIATLALLVTVGVLVKSLDAKDKQVTTMEIALQEAAKVITVRNQQIAALSATNDNGAAQAAQQCAQQGDGAYMRGVAVGRAIGARQCAA